MSISLPIDLKNEIDNDVRIALTPPVNGQPALYNHELTQDDLRDTQNKIQQLADKALLLGQEALQRAYNAPTFKTAGIRNYLLNECGENLITQVLSKNLHCIVEIKQCPSVGNILLGTPFFRKEIYSKTHTDRSVYETDYHEIIFEFSSDNPLLKLPKINQFIPTPQSILDTDFENLKSGKLAGDVQFNFSDKPTGLISYRVWAHKTVLMRLEYFRKLFQATPLQHSISVEEFSHTEFILFLEFLYRGTIDSPNTKEFSLILSLYKLAHLYKFERLKEWCRANFNNAYSINQESLKKIIEEARLQNDEPLLEHIVKKAENEKVLLDLLRESLSVQKKAIIRAVQKHGSTKVKDEVLKTLADDDQMSDEG